VGERCRRRAPDVDDDDDGDDGQDWGELLRCAPCVLFTVRTTNDELRCVTDSRTTPLTLACQHCSRAHVASGRCRL